MIARSGGGPETIFEKNKIVLYIRTAITYIYIMRDEETRKSTQKGDRDMGRKSFWQVAAKMDEARTVELTARLEVPGEAHAEVYSLVFYVYTDAHVMFDRAYRADPKANKSWPVWVPVVSLPKELNEAWKAQSIYVLVAIAVSNDEFELKINR